MASIDFLPIVDGLSMYPDGWQKGVYSKLLMLTAWVLVSS